MKVVFEEDVLNVLDILGNAIESLNIEKLEQQLNNLQKKIEEMGAVWKTMQASSEMQDIERIIEGINCKEIYELVNSIYEIKTGYQIDNVIGTDNGQGV